MDRTLAPTEKKALLRYHLILTAATLPLLVLTLWQAFRGGGLRYMKQRLGFGYRPNLHRPVWLHAASVGEVIAILPLIKKLQSNYSSHNIVVTTTTNTGADIVKQRLGQSVTHHFFPIDWSGCVVRFLNSTHPVCALIMETELWPNLYSHCRLRNIPLIIINGRLSKRTLETRAWIKFLYQVTLNHVTAILARSRTDADRFLSLGANPETIHVIGNIKFAVTNDPDQRIPAIALGRPYVLAASTHDDEELRISKLWLDMDVGDRLLVIAPRHPKRAASILKQINSVTSDIAVRSTNDTIAGKTKIYLADTLGELKYLLKGAELVFVGGSLVPAGGHNILEPALFGKPILFGPYMSNFAEETKLFLHHQAALQVSNETELSAQLLSLFTDTEKCRTLSTNARRLMDNNKNIVDRYLSEIARFVDLDRDPE